MKKRYLSYIAYLILILFPLLVVLCSRGSVSVDGVFSSLPHIDAFDFLFSAFGISSVWLTYMSNYLTYALLVSLCHTGFLAITFLLDVCNRALRKEY